MTIRSAILPFLAAIALTPCILHGQDFDLGGITESVLKFGKAAKSVKEADELTQEQQYFRGGRMTGGQREIVRRKAREHLARRRQQLAVARHGDERARFFRHRRT